MNQILDIRHLVKRFGKAKSGFTAVDDISFTVEKGEMVGLLGPNGAGKTTTIAMLLGILMPTSGNIKIFDMDINTHRQEIAGRMNFSSAYTKMPWRLKVWEHLYVFAKLYDVPDPMARVEKFLTIFDLERYKNILGGDLSAGNTAKVNLAKAFINYPELVLLDEPTSSIDPEIARSVRKYILEVQEKYNTSILITSHNMAEITELCDRVIFMSHGKITAEGTPEELAKTIPITKIRLFMHDGQKRTIEYCQKSSLPIVVSERHVEIETREEKVAGFLNDLAKMGVEYKEITINKPTLEDYFIGNAENA